MKQYANSEDRLMSVSEWLHGMGLAQYESHFMNTGIFLFYVIYSMFCRSVGIGELLRIKVLVFGGVCMQVV